MTTGEKIKKIRTSKKIKQSELALKIGVPQSTLSKYETGNLRIDTDTIVKIANALGVSSFDLLTNEHQQNNSNADKDIMNSYRTDWINNFFTHTGYGITLKQQLELDDILLNLKRISELNNEQIKFELLKNINDFIKFKLSNLKEGE